MNMKPSLGICIMRSPQKDNWVVTLCHSPDNREVIGQFSTREEAAEFAITERDRRRDLADVEPCIEVPDDCPCHRSS